jgi:hypothetical protein
MSLNLAIVQDGEGLNALAQMVDDVNSALSKVASTVRTDVVMPATTAALIHTAMTER